MQPEASPLVKPGEKAQEVDLAWLQAEVERVLAQNRVTVVRAGKEVTYHAPSLDGGAEGPPWLRWLGKAWWLLTRPWQVHYPHQWFWDSSLQAIVLSYFDGGLAQKEIEGLLGAQGEGGFIPHMIWNQRRMHWVDRLLQWLYPGEEASPYLHPPALAEAVEEVYRRGGDLAFVARVLPQLQRYYLYLDRVRNRDKDGLLQIIISYESGKDRSREYDGVYGQSNALPAWRGPMTRVMLRYWLLGWDMERIFAARRFLVKDLLLNTIYAQNLVSLSRLSALAGDEKGAALFGEMAQRTEAAILAKMYDPETGLFYSLDARGQEDQLIRVSTISSLMPLILDTITQPQVERLVQGYLHNPEEFWSAYPLPAEPLSLPEEAEGHLVWRGPQTWVIANWYLGRGLRKQASRFPEHGGEYRALADELTLKTYALVRREGFREYFDARTGEGGGAYPFGGSTLLLDMVYNMGQ